MLASFKIRSNQPSMNVYTAYRDKGKRWWRIISWKWICQAITVDTFCAKILRSNQRVLLWAAKRSLSRASWIEIWLKGAERSCSEGEVFWNAARLVADDLQQRASQPSYHNSSPNLCETAIDQNSSNLASPVKAAHGSRITRSQKRLVRQLQPPAMAFPRITGLALRLRRVGMETGRNKVI